MGSGLELVAAGDSDPERAELEGSGQVGQGWLDQVG